MKRELLNASIRFGTLADRLEKLQDQIAATVSERNRLVTDLAATMTHVEVGHLLGISAKRVGQLSGISDSSAARAGGGE